ncbi:MAG: Gfo/Idh/MocA family protein [Caldisphaera sp.]
MREQDQLRFAVIGCGTAGICHIQAIKELPEAKLVAIACTSRGKKEAIKLSEKYKCDYYIDYLEMLKRDDIDVVSVAVPHWLHSEIGINIAKAGKHIIVEKPIDISINKAYSLIRAAHEANVKLCVIFQSRFAEDVVLTKQAIEDGKIGKINFAAAYLKLYREQEYYDDNPWRGKIKLSGGGVLINQSIHYVDLLRYLAGPIEEVFGYITTRGHKNIEVEDEAVATIKFANGAIGIIEGSTIAYPGFGQRIDIYGDKGSIVIKNDKIIEWKLKSHEPNPSVVKEIRSGIDSPDIIDITLHKRQIQDMIKAIKDNREPFINGEEGLSSLEIVLAIYKSAETHKPVRLPLKLL